MIKDYTQFSVGPMTVEVNWNEVASPCKKIKFTFEGHEAIVDREDLYALMMLFGDEKQQEELIPVIQAKVKAIRRLIKFRVKKDMKRGEIAAFPYTYFIPEAIYERLLLDKSYSSPDALSTPDLGKIVRKERK